LWLESGSHEASERRECEPRLTGALIIGGAHGSLGIIRSLGRRGIPVWFVTDDHPIARYSRYTQRNFTWSGPDHKGAAEFLLQLSARHGQKGWLLIAGGDAELRLISKHHAALASAFRMTVPAWDVARWAYDKRLTYQRAGMLGIDHPWSYYPRDRQELAHLDCRFPVILKPAVRERQNAFTQAKAWRVDDRATLSARYDEAARLVGESAIVLQELIPGGGSTQFSYAGVWDRGSPVVSLVARRARQYPIDFGYTSTFVETIEQKEIEDAATRFLRSIGYTGLVEVEFKYDERDSRYKLLDINARVWTWCALGAISGVDFAHVLWRLKMGESIAPVRGQANARWMHASRDIVAAFQEMTKGTLSPGSFIKSWCRPIVFADFAKDDPLPGIVDLPLVAARLLTRRLPNLVRRIRRAFGSRTLLARLRSLLP
jgi:D-aspartate ligase